MMCGGTDSGEGYQLKGSPSQWPYSITHTGPTAVGYPYTLHLLEFDRRRPRGRGQVPKEWRAVETPLACDEWGRALRDHPDRAFVEYLVRGMREGFRIGYQYGKRKCVGAKANMKSAEENDQVVDEYVAKEVQLGRVVGPLEEAQHPAVHINRFGVIPKNHQPGKWRLIVDLSHPDGESVNDGIERELCTLKYTSVDEAVTRVLAKGAGTVLAKFDVESAYRIIPVHPEDRWLLGMRWRGKLYVDTALPFGLRSAPKIFSAVADALQWILARLGVESIHYLDDFLIFGAPNTPQCQQALECALQWCRRLGVPIAGHKTEGPARKWALRWTHCLCHCTSRMRSYGGCRGRLDSGWVGRPAQSGSYCH